MLLRYLWQWLKAACSGVWGIADSAAGFVALVGLILVKQYPAAEAAMGDLAWQVPLSILGLLVLSRLILVPYRLHVEEIEKRRAVEAERDALQVQTRDLTTPKLSLTFDQNCIGQLENWQTPTPSRTVYLIIENLSAVPITKIDVRCEAIFVASEVPKVASPQDCRPLTIGRSSHYWELPPRGAKHIPVVRERLDRSGGISFTKQLELLIAANPTYSPQEFGREFLIDVKVYATEESEPQRTSFTFGWHGND